MDGKDERKVNITINPDATKPVTYNEQIVKFDKEEFHIHFANRNDTADEINIDVKEIISIPAKDMRTFCYHIIDSLLEYGKTYDNGYGLKLPQKGKA